MIRLSQPNDGPGNPRTRFAPGDLVRHREYGYRGVVVALDPRCLADDLWNDSRRVRADREQPWYHVLVDGTVGRTYAAQGDLLSDAGGEPVDHPLVEEFFTAFAGGRYSRNERPWEW